MELRNRLIQESTLGKGVFYPISGPPPCIPLKRSPYPKEFFVHFHILWVQQMLPHFVIGDQAVCIYRDFRKSMTCRIRVQRGGKTSNLTSTGRVIWPVAMTSMHRKCGLKLSHTITGRRLFACAHGTTT